MQEFEELEDITCSIKENRKAFDEIEHILYKFKDIRKSIERCKNGSVLDEVELFEIKNFCLNLRALKSLISEAKISNIILHSLDDVYTILDPEGKNIPTFYIYNVYSEKLNEIRNKKLEIEKRFFLKLMKKHKSFKGTKIKSGDS
ncbi:hypothetical protein [Caloramator sp. Dgby_cultured_2]|uniref:hypothetical protein n=1 Tax=Caloramator sp. Dgby_cultured_2 TaxID=3029174 RepID=UPI00237E248D|nr:hypothetical protein [Caloramator sp. Dgby_cultured_2]WDU83680.1 hypothetical protein PWK10_03605 [Caloramator sp. Dgby_cultured_2]